MKKTLDTFVCLAVLVGIIFLGSECSRNKSTGMAVSDMFFSDTIKARDFMKRGDEKKWSDPDSASVCYHRAITLLHAYSVSKNIEIMIASCYSGLVAINNYNGNYKLAAAYDSVVEQIGAATGNKDVIAQSLLNRGLLFYNQSEYPSALEYYKRAEDLCSETGNKRLAAKILSNRAIIFSIQGDPYSAISCFSKTREIAESIGNNELLSGSDINLGMMFHDMGKDELAIDYYEKAIEICKKIKDENGIIICYQNIGDVWFKRSNFEKALDAFDESLQRASRIGDKSNMSKGYHNIGEVYSFLGDYETAINDYVRSANIKKELNDQLGMVSVYASIGNLKVQLGEYDEALNYFNQSLEISQKLKCQNEIALRYGDLANVYSCKKQWDRSLMLALKSLESHKTLHFQEQMTELYALIGSIYAGLSDYENARRYLDLSLENSHRRGDKLGMSVALNAIGNLMVSELEQAKDTNKTAFYQEAVRYGETALSLSKAENALPTQLENIRFLINAYKNTGDYKRALTLSEESLSINDSILNKEKNKALVLAEVKWNAGKKQQEITRLRKEWEIQDNVIRQKEKENSLKNLVIGLLGTIVLLTLITGFSIFKYFQKKRDILFQKQLANMTFLRMQSIRNRMSPHFFFNVLSIISSEASDPVLVKKNLDRLSLLLRKSIENIEQTAIPLKEEIDIVKAYIELQRQRIPGAFDVDFDLQPEVGLNRPVLAMMIQIPVENAIKHGLMPLVGKKKLQIVIEQSEKGGLIVLIRDNGIGLKASRGRSTGTGTGLKVLLQTIALFNQKNKEKIEFTIDQNSPDKLGQTGVSVRVFIPEGFFFNQNVA